jgi:PleD family two-component response regulator
LPPTCSSTSRSPTRTRRCGRFFSKHFPREVQRAARYGRALSLVLCDIDLFKGINDTHGHACGDQVLREFSARLQHSLRRGIDWVARIGGEEFAVVSAASPERLLKIADAALYRSKNTGRNRVTATMLNATGD